MVELVHRSGFFAHHLGRAHPAVVEDARARAEHPELIEMIPVPAPETLGITPGDHAALQPDRTHLMAVGGRRAVHHEEIAVEVNVVEEQAVHVVTFMGALQRRADLRVVILVDHFVGLEINSPVALAVGERQISLLRQDSPITAELLVPERFQHFQLGLGVGKRLNPRKRFVFPLAHDDHELVNEREKGAQALQYGIVEFHAVAHEGEAGDA